jgi:hypothetical protein
LFLAFMVAMILFRALHRDISKYNRVSDLKNIVTTPLVDLTIIL